MVNDSSSLSKSVDNYIMCRRVITHNPHSFERFQTKESNLMLHEKNGKSNVL